MKWPLDKIIFTQTFGENPQYYAQFGLKGHEGIDFKTRYIGNSWGFWYDFMGWKNVYAVCDGTVEANYGHPTYGTNITLTDSQGNKWHYAHLKNAKCQTGQQVKEGQIIAISGNSGKTSGPHLHLAYKPVGSNPNNGYNGYVDPMPILKPDTLQIKVARVGLNLVPLSLLNAELSKYSNGKLSLVSNDYIHQITGHLDQFDAYHKVDSMGLNEEFIFFFFIADSSYNMYATYSYPAKGRCITTGPAQDLRSLVFELSHQLQIFYNMNRGYYPYIEIVDSNFPSDELITSKLESISLYYNVFK